MRMNTNPQKIMSAKNSDDAWKWVAETCHAISAIQNGGDGTVEKAKENYDEVSRLIRKKGMTGRSLIEITIKWASEKIEESKK